VTTGDGAQFGGALRPESDVLERASPAASWLLWALSANAALFLLGGFAPAQNGDWSGSEASWLTVFALSTGLAVSALVIGVRLLRVPTGTAPRALRDALSVTVGAGRSLSARTVLVAPVVAAGAVAAIGVLVLVTRHALVPRFEDPASTQQWVGAYLVASATGAAVALLVPVRAVGPSSPRSGTAMGSFIAAIAGLQMCIGMLLVPSLAAVVLGHLALRQLGRSSGSIGGRDYAVLGLRLGYLGTASGLAIWAWVIAG
jgi:hypothetical protein